MYYKVDNVYDINKIKIVFFKIVYNGSIDGYYGTVGIVKQLFYADNGCLIDIFKDKYIDGIYKDNEIPSFNYNPVNCVDIRMFSDNELKSGFISERRLLEIYCNLNSNYISYDSLSLTHKHFINAISSILEPTSYD